MAVLVYLENISAYIYRNKKLKRKQYLSTTAENHQSVLDLPNKDGPDIQYELARKRVSKDVQELWYYVSSELTQFRTELVNKTPQLAGKLDRIIAETAEHKRSLLHVLGILKARDSFDDWRWKESLDLSDLVQRRLEYLQNPPDCRTARKLVCELNKGCGYGCQLHHVVYCFIVAYATRRTLILDSKEWSYSRGGWEEVFQPVSKTCTSPEGVSNSGWPGNNDTQVIYLPIIEFINPRPPYLPLAIPEDLEPRLSRLHGDPIVWWIGQFLTFLNNPTPNTREIVAKYGEKIKFQKPIVGIHIRRTDKVDTEAALHPVEEYMTGVEEYYKQLALTQTVDVKRVYVATDDASVLTEIREKYPQYSVLGDPSIARTASLEHRYLKSSLLGIITDLHYLSNCDHLVCTFSSQICRTAYEQMNAKFPDASDRYRSLDDIYYFGGQLSRIHIAVLPHTPRHSSEMDLMVGDRISVAGNHWNGYSKGRNLRTDQLALYPTFKSVPHVETARFPTYPEVPSRWPNVKKAAFRQKSTKFGMDLHLNHAKLLGRGDTENHLYEQYGALQLANSQLVAEKEELAKELKQVQKEWDSIQIKHTKDHLCFTKTTDSARYQALQCKESNSWLHAIPSSQIGTLLDSSSFHTSVALRLGCTITTPFTCQCGRTVNSDGIHGLSCEKSAGRFSRHSELNDVICRALSSLDMHPTLEPTGISRSDGKRPDGMTLIAWSRGQKLIWDVTVVDTLADSYVSRSSTQPRSAAEAACQRKRIKYANLIQDGYIFKGLALETMGPFCNEMKIFIDDIGNRLCKKTGDVKAKSFL
ncbi:alpha-(1,6)-fucosyltransferase-like [Diaphorina citri]|uniref:Alpha-(1,6)-fucosyltransferase n=1 Tax=Diaphorina citri TaxID=121845 RepID=A0A3Q0J8N4_DIACI|nr:alpha-(1,6)-fucosyltransferase-like [Diaphorina citri]